MQKADLYDLLMNKPIPYKKKQHDVKINKIEILEAEDPEDQKQIVIPFLRELPSPSIRCSKYLLGQSKLKNYSYI